MDLKITYCVMLFISTCTAMKMQGKPDLCDRKERESNNTTFEDGLLVGIVKTYCSNTKNISDAIQQYCQPMEDADCQNCSIKITFYREHVWSIKLKVSNGTHVFKYKTSPDSTSCNAIREPIANTTSTITEEGDTSTYTLSKTDTTTQPTSTSDDQTITTASENTHTEGFHQRTVCPHIDVKHSPSPIQILGYVALGLVCGIAVSTMVFCVIMKRQLNKKVMTKSSRHMDRRSEASEIRDKNGVSNVLYSDLDEAGHIPVSEVHPIRRAEKSAIQDYEDQKNPQGQQHVYTDITDAYNAVSTKRTQVQEKDPGPENVYNHLHGDDEVENTAANDYDHVTGSGQKINSSFLTDDYDHMPGAQEKINPLVLKEFPKANDEKDPNDFYFVLQKPDLEQEDGIQIESGQVDEPNSDNYFYIETTVVMRLCKVACVYSLSFPDNVGFEPIQSYEYHYVLNMPCYISNLPMSVKIAGMFRVGQDNTCIITVDDKMSSLVASTIYASICTANIFRYISN